MARRRETTQPYLDHDTLTQAQQAKHLGVKQETIRNLGHPCAISDIQKNPAGRLMDYDTADTKATFRDRGSTGVYGKFDRPTSGHDLAAWSDRASANSFHGKNPSGRGQGSDNHLASTKG
jgi:hypothetical protein